VLARRFDGLGESGARPAVRERAPSILCFATKGGGTNEEARILGLLSAFDVDRFDFVRANKRGMSLALLREIRRRRPSLVVMEGTGLAGGLALILARRLFRTRFVVSSGDAVGPIIGLLRPGLGGLGRIYERLLYRSCAGFIGWTPYLVGRAITYGAPRAMTAANWTLFTEPRAGRDRTRERLGIPADAVVFGLVGALVWTDPPGYCYGMELVAALRNVSRDDVRVLIVGGGSGLDRLRDLAAEDGDERLILTGPADHEDVLDHMLAMDVGSLPQSTDEIGALRYTTKLSEYLSAGLPIVTGQIPLAYDLDGGWVWRMPGDGPWDARYVAALADLMERLGPDDLAARRSAVPRDLKEFDADDQKRRVAAFIADLLRADAAPV
jgi:glycosyltransferase involved in cell wall biosynthesis